MSKNAYPYSIHIVPARNGFLVHIGAEIFVYQNHNVMLTHLRKLLKDPTLIRPGVIGGDCVPDAWHSLSRWANEELSKCPSDVEPYP